jgi:tetratricopeptide (TPR) repeat protein
MIRVTCVAFFCLLLLTAGETLGQAKKKKEKRQNQEMSAPSALLPAKSAPLSAKEAEVSESNFVEGMKFFMLEDYGRALERFQRAHAANPRNAAINYKMAETNLLQGDAKAALPFARAATELDNQNAYYYLLLAQIYGSLEQFDEAIKVYGKLVKEVPGADQYMFNLADMYLSRNRLDEALKTYETIEKKYGQLEEVTFKKQHIFLKQNNLEKAIKEGENLIEANPSEVRYILAQAELLASNNKIEQAISTITLALKREPHHPFARLLLADLLRQQGKLIESNSELVKAFNNSELDIDTKVKIMVDLIGQLRHPPDQALLQTTLDMADIIVELHPQEAKAFAVAADIQTIAEKKDLARRNYLRATRLDNSHFKIWQQIILLDAEMNQTDSLVAHTEQALELFPNQAVFWFYNGTGHLIKRNYAKATKSLEYGKKLSGDNQDLLVQFNAQLGDAYNALKQHDKSDAAYEAALAFDSSNPHVLNNYSYFLSLRNQNLEKAKTLSGKLVAKHPNNPTYLDTYAWVLYKMKNYQEAKKYLEKALTTSSDATVIEHYGDVLYQLGDKEEALKQWIRAKEQGEGEASELISKKIKDKKLYE